MTLLIACLLIYGQGLPDVWYLVAALLWLIHVYYHAGAE